MHENGQPHDDKEEQPVKHWDLIKRMLGLVWEYRYGCIKVLALQLILLAMGIFGLGLMGLGVDFIRFQMTPDSSTSITTSAPASLPAGTGQQAPVIKPPNWPMGIAPPEHWSTMSVLGSISALILIMALLRAALSFAATVETNALVQAKIVVKLRSMLYAKMQRLSFKFFDANESGSLINRVTGDVQSVRMFVDQVVLTTVILMLSLIIYLIYMIRIHPMLTLVCLASTPMIWVLTTRFSRTVRPAYHENRERFDRLILALSENVQGVHVVKGFARQPEQINSFGKMNSNFRKQQRWIFKQVSFFQPLIHFITHVNMIAMIAYGGYLVVKFEQAPDAVSAAAAGISVGQLLVFAGLLQQFSAQITNISSIVEGIQRSLIGAQRVFEILDAPLEVSSPPHPVHVTAPEGELRFDNVSFEYNPDEIVLNNISLCVKPGSCAAILGQTGSGKSTLLSLIPRFYDPTKGRILLDNKDLRDLDLEDLRKNIGVVFQESFLFSNTVADNIAFGHPEATREQIEEAAKIAHAHEFIIDLPKGYDTILHEGGSNLSGGQRQRIAIARALVLQPKIILMDDPTAAIDPETEKDIMKAMESAMTGRTSLIVAHRLSTLRRADSVLVLNKGTIIQRGTHEELMQTKGQYRWAARLQIPDQISLDLLREGDKAQL